MVEEKRRSVGFCAIHCFGSSKEKKNQGMELWYGLLVWKLSQAILVNGLLGKT